MKKEGAPMWVLTEKQDVAVYHLSLALNPEGEKN